MEGLNLGNIDGRMLIFGGPYSNLAATRAMQLKAQALNIPPERIICTGDLVAYCAEPVETIELIQDWGIPVVMGNCEESLAADSDDCGCGFDEGSACSILSDTWFKYANSLVKNPQRRWMVSLPRSIRFLYSDLDCRVIHAGLSSINRFIFESDSLVDKGNQIKQAAADVVISGHSGLPFGQKTESGYWLNAGVIGMPANDGSADTWYMLLDSNSRGAVASWHRLSYSVERSQRSTRAAGMVEYARALVDGLWPSLDVLPVVERKRRGRLLELKPLTLLRP